MYLKPIWDEWEPVWYLTLWCKFSVRQIHSSCMLSRHRGLFCCCIFTPENRKTINFLWLTPFDDFSINTSQLHPFPAKTSQQAVNGCCELKDERNFVCFYVQWTLRVCQSPYHGPILYSMCSVKYTLCTNISTELFWQLKPMLLNNFGTISSLGRTQGDSYWIKMFVC